MVLEDQAGVRSREFDMRGLLVQTQECLQSAADVVRSDSDAALDDILAARLLISTLLLQLESGDDVAGMDGDRPESLTARTPSQRQGQPG